MGVLPELPGRDHRVGGVGDRDVVTARSGICRLDVRQPGAAGTRSPPLVPGTFRGISQKPQSAAALDLVKKQVNFLLILTGYPPLQEISGTDN